ncbi:MAG: ABC transporter ATP-binding protein/permease [Pseudomonas sp.]|uniref:ABC transporter ATP-binding protein n=2 Tax=unclassified Pseudomonas TaxID=196821 RepID=UPI002648F3E0|nr:ABC transporter ATP-binding protein [Pseudomonas sp.]MDN5405961.1 ABC transporter ATP-binding protein/permease [Pseudomonas sp.]MDN5453663.1 ABC transporter ATP-binding protein/permease [Pseudomonas sp.]MDN5457502.1 ABC transporter ATP-binding protein/permease [Pseudomonas sp.]
MLKPLLELLGDDAPVLHRYVWMAVFYGLLSGLTLTTLVPVLGHLLANDLRGAALWLLLTLAGMAVCWACRRRVERAGVAVGVALLQGARQRIGDHVARLPLGWFTTQNTGHLGHVITQGMMAVAQLPAHVFTPVISGAVTPLVIVAALFAVHWPLGLIALLGLAVLAGALLLSARLGQRTDRAFQRHFADASQRMVEFAQAQSVLRAFNGEGGGTQLLEQALERQRQSGLRLIYQSSLSVVLNTWVVQVIFAALLIAAALWLNGLMGDTRDNASVIAVVIALLLSSRYIEPLLDVAGYAEILRSASGQLDAVQAIFAARPLPEPDQPQPPRDGSIELRAVSMAYAPDQPDVLHDVSLRIEPGSMTALIGASGSGKTTLVRLIARFFDAREGCVLVGGVDVRHMSDSQLAGQISQIFQDCYLFQGSIADNIRIGKPTANADEILEAAQQAGLGELVGRLPQGLDTPVGEGGARLSGGERQRIAIARALIKEAAILLVDEATAALDAENQHVIARTLARLRGQRTLVVIAHQLSTVSMADRIVVLDHGRVAEQGTPAALLAAKGRYAKFLEQRRAAKGWRVASGSELQ